MGKIRTMRFEKVYNKWKAKRTTQREGAEPLGMSARTFRRYVVRYEVQGVEGLGDRRVGRVSPRRACEEEIRALETFVQGPLLGTQRQALLRGVQMRVTVAGAVTAG